MIIIAVEVISNVTPRVKNIRTRFRTFLFLCSVMIATEYEIKAMVTIVAAIMASGFTMFYYLVNNDLIYYSIKKYYSGISSVYSKLGYPFLPSELKKLVNLSLYNSLSVSFIK